MRYVSARGGANGWSRKKSSDEIGLFEMIAYFTGTLPEVRDRNQQNIVLIFQ